VHAGTARTGERRALTLVAKACANAPDFLSGAFPKGNALLDRGRQRAGQLGLLVHQGVIAGGHRSIDGRLQIPQLAQLADHPLTDLVHDVGNVGIARGIELDKLRLEPRAQRSR
jgi:hypothetical protein